MIWLLKMFQNTLRILHKLSIKKIFSPYCLTIQVKQLISSDEILVLLKKKKKTQKPEQTFLKMVQINLFHKKMHFTFSSTEDSLHTKRMIFLKNSYVLLITKGK